MGCSTSKLDDLPAVVLCRERCGFLEAAIQQRYALAESHLAYTQSLKAIGHSLHTFINLHHSLAGEDPQHDSPNKPIPDSGSGHLEFDSESESDSDSVHSSPLHHHLEDEDPSYPASYLHMNFMKNTSMPPSVVYEQRPSSPHRVYMGESSTSSYNPYLYPPSYGSSSKQPRPPPSPPRSEAWDFMNLFDYAPYTPSRDSRELREEEGIPDLEDEHEVVKEVQGKQKLVPPIPVENREEPPGNSGGASTSGGGGQASLYQTRPSVSVEKEEKEYEVHVVEKQVVEDSGEQVRRSNAASRGGGGMRRGVTLFDIFLHFPLMNCSWFDTPKLMS